MEGWRIEIQDRPAMFYTDIFVFRRSYDNKTILYKPKDEDVVGETEYEGGALIPPSFTLPNDLLPALMEALVRKGVKPPEQSFLKGKLEATDAHLQDMRRLLKLVK